MEANTTSYTVLSVLKWLFPSLLGSALAVWYKRHDVEWKGLSKADKLLYSLIGVGAICLGCVIGLAIGNTIITYAGMTEYWYKFSILVVSGLCSLKVIDAIVKNSDDIIQLVVSGIKKVITKFFDKFTGGK